MAENGKVAKQRVLTLRKISERDKREDDNQRDEDNAEHAAMLHRRRRPNVTRRAVTRRGSFGVMSFSPKRSERLFRRQDVLIDAEEVRRIVLTFDSREAIVVLAVRRADAILPFVHHEIDVRAAR